MQNELGIIFLGPRRPSFRGPEGAVGIRLFRWGIVGPAALLAMTKNDPARRYVGAHLCVRPEGVGGHAGPPLQDGQIRYIVGAAPYGCPPAKIPC